MFLSFQNAPFPPIQSDAKCGPQNWNTPFPPIQSDEMCPRRTFIIYREAVITAPLIFIPDFHRFQRSTDNAVTEGAWPHNRIDASSSTRCPDIHHNPFPNFMHSTCNILLVFAWCTDDYPIDHNITVSGVLVNQCILIICVWFGNEAFWNFDGMW